MEFDSLVRKSCESSPLPPKASNIMRTTLNIDNDVLHAARELARQNGKPIGQIISGLARMGMSNAGPDAVRRSKTVCGFRPFLKMGRTVSNELINQLREGGEY